ncbi:MAG: ATP-dependent 6-phosphofructokinase [Deltaproteobacteria bacterium]|nr:ATP-dependent 6-phosphofructokinase [Deltaproteobacteria bacterium]
MKRVGVLTGGGDCPGLNAAIRAIVRRSHQHGFESVGILEGWRGLTEGLTRDLDRDAVSGILHVGGTILKTSRTNPSKMEGGFEKVEANFKKIGLDALVAIGGEDTLGVARSLHERGLPVVGVPKTIDNDLGGTDFTFGFNTAVSIVTEAIDRLHSTAESHNRAIVVEVMGRHTGWIATYAGIAGGADVILVPEFPVDLENVCNHLRSRHKLGRSFSIVVVAEGARIGKDENIVSSRGTDAFGHARLGGIGMILAEEIEKRTGFETRVTSLGHVQRGGSPTAFDRVLATRYGVFAADLVKEGKFGKMAALRGNDIVAVDLADAVKSLKTVDPRLFELAGVFFG